MSISGYIGFVIKIRCWGSVEVEYEVTHGLSIGTTIIFDLGDLKPS